MGCRAFALVSSPCLIWTVQHNCVDPFTKEAAVAVSAHIFPPSVLTIFTGPACCFADVIRRHAAGFDAQKLLRKHCWLPKDGFLTCCFLQHDVPQQCVTCSARLVVCVCSRNLLVRELRRVL